MNSNVKMKVCDICGQPAAKNSDDLACEQSVIPGSDGSKIFNEHLRLYFILTKLLHCSEKESLNLLTKLAESKVASENEEIVFKACGNCDDTVRKAFELHQNVVAVKKNIDKLGETLTSLIKLSDKDCDDKSGSSLRQAFRQLCFGTEVSNSAYVKLEVGHEEFENENFDDSYFEDAQHNRVQGESGRLDEDNFQHDEQESETESTRHERMLNRSAGKLTCDLCDSVFTSELGFRKHERMHEESRLLGNIYDCSLCRHPNLSDSKLRRHMTRIHGRRNKGPSQKRDLELIDDKMIKQDNDSDSDFEPTSTRKVFQKNRARNRILKLAKRTITQKTRRLQAAATQKYFPCELCDCVYESLYAYRRHLVAHENSKLLMNAFDCPQCKYPALSEEKLRRHIIKRHETTKNTCHICGHFSSKRCLHERHMQTEHNVTVWEPISSGNTENASISALDCETTMVSESLSTTENTTGKTYKCELCDCGVVYTTTQGLRKHERVHEQSNLLGNMFDCQYCRYPTLTDRSLRKHLTHMHDDSDSTTSPKQIQRVQEFGSSVDLKTDVTEQSSQDSEKPSKHKIYTMSTNGHYKCKLCKSTYTTYPGIRKHERMHAASDKLGNLYNCRICQHPNLSAPKLKRHMTAVHGIRHKIGTSFRQLTGESNDNEKRIDNLNQVKREPTSSTSVHLEDDITENSSLDTEDSFKNKIYELSTDGIYKCKLCESTYTSFTGITKHERMHNESDKLGNCYDCRICRHPNTSDSNLNRHMTVVHNRSQHKMGPSSSNVTEESTDYLNSDQLEQRTSSATDVTENSFGNKIYELSTDGIYNCKLCESTYTTFPGIRKHELMHAESDKLGNLYDCKICRHPNVSDSNLNRHMTVVHNRSQLKIGPSSRSLTEESNDCVSSEKVKQSTSSANDVAKNSFGNKIYELSTNGIYKCKLCESTYTSFTGIRKHERMHNESDKLGNRYDCRICRHPNVSGPNLNRHMWAIHKSRSKLGKSDTRVTEENNDHEYNSLSVEKTAESRTSRTRMQINPKFNESSDEEEATTNSKDDDWIPPSDGENSPERIDSPDHGEGRQTENQGAHLYHCSKCNVDYKSSRGYERHEEEHEASESLGHKYDCHCGFPASSERRLCYHKRRAHLDAFTCSVCGFRVKHQKQLISHMRKHYPSYINRKHGARNKESRFREKGTKSTATIQCKLCKASYWYQESYKRHLKDHEKSKLIGDVWECKICKFPCLTERSLQTHRRKHLNRSLKTVCSICSKVVINGRLQDHMRMHAEYDQTMDEATGLYRCKFCPYVGRTLQGIICHKTSLHRDAVLDPSVEYSLCPQCGMRFINQLSLKKHIKNIHENKFNHTCEKCGKGFDSLTAFNKHRETHDENRKRDHICDTCGAAYSHKQSLQAHIKKFHSTQFANIPASDRDGRRFPKDKDYKCRWCETVFPFKYMLNNHMPTAHQDLYTFTCDQCDKKYITSSSLKLHKEIAHLNDSKTYTCECEYCHKSFSHRHYLICHYKFCNSKRELDKGSSELRSEET